ncbi:hypothetical protein BU26DRAFT_593660 [Trematosphaeria pertusa]|uniref:F-box domain-containing protein n=1 Tax=Trematosphaeria pertusa TaxID=390896 RepID=A0A6A6IH95_9PLEO|nr:uncharacterized protein BU26DRAFT_593660 [Trematosphaeria pertusa]KAF2249964.1 hypothetical protein BU26DRAFT_593660 [Trematosphaeria pertusa]
MSDSNSTGNASIAEPPFRFLALPGEIRNQVYECVVANFESDRLRHTRSVREVLRHLPVPIWAFLLTCKQIRAELLEHCYRSYVWLANLRITTKGFEPFELNGDRSWMLQPEDEWMPPAGALSKARSAISGAGSERGGSEDIELAGARVLFGDGATCYYREQTSGNYGREEDEE